MSATVTSNGILSLKALLPVLRQPEPANYLQLYYKYTSYFDFFCTFLILGTSYFVGTAMKYTTSVLLIFVLIKNFFGSHATLAIELMRQASEGSFMSSIFNMMYTCASYEIVAVALSIVIGLLMARGGAITSMVGLLLCYISYFTNLVKSSNTTSTYLINFLFAAGITFPIVVMFFFYSHFDLIFAALTNATISTFLLVWFLDKNVGISFSKDNSPIERLVIDFAEANIMSLYVLVTLLFIVLSVISQLILTEPTVSVYYVVKTRLIKVKENIVSKQDNQMTNNKVEITSNNGNTEKEFQRY